MGNENTVKLISMDTIPVQKVEWLVYPFIPCGKIAIIQGDPGEGKTTFILQLIARLTTGRPAWDGMPPMTPRQRDLPDGGGWFAGYHQATTRRRRCGL